MSQDNHANIAIGFVHDIIVLVVHNRKLLIPATSSYNGSGHCRLFCNYIKKVHVYLTQTQGYHSSIEHAC